jgi:hypothetical protein
MLGCSYGTAVYNNIVYQNNASEDAFGLYHNSCGTEPVISDNYWYNPNIINRIKYSKEIYTANMQEEWNEKHPGDKFDNPLMNDPEAGDYSLYEKNLKIGAVYSETGDTLLSTESSVTVLVVYIQNPGTDLQQLAELVYQKTGTQVSTEQIQTLFDEHGLNI